MKILSVPKPRLFFVLTGWIILGGAALPARAESLSWTGVVQETARDNPELRAARETLRSSDYSVRGSYNDFFPQVSGTLGYAYGTSSPSQGAFAAVPSVTGTEASGSYTASLTASENLFTGFKDQATVNQALANRRVSEAALVTTQAKVSVDLMTAYSGLLFAERSVQLQNQIVKRREDNLKLVGLRFQSGRENKGSVLLSRAYLNQAHYEAMQAVHNLGVAKTQLAQVLGRDWHSDEDPEFVVSEDIPLEPTQVTPDFRALAIGTPDHLRSVAQEDVADAGVTLARSAFFPSLGLTASTSRNGKDWFPQSDRWTVGASISFPIFNGGKDYYGTRSALATRSAASETRANVDRQTLAKLRQTFFAYVEAVEKLRVDESFREAALKRAEIARSKYDNGLMTFEDWDLIENDLIQRERTVLQSQTDRVTSQAAWQQAQGKGVIQ